MWRGEGADGVGRRQKLRILILIRVGADLCYFDADLSELEEGCSDPGPVLGSVSLPKHRVESGFDLINPISTGLADVFLELDSIRRLRCIESGRDYFSRKRVSDACQVPAECQQQRSLQMEPQGQHGSGGSVVVIQQPSLDSRQRLDYERESQPTTILSLDQIKAIRGSNEYTEGPSVVKKSAPRTAPRQEKHERTHEIIPINVNNNYEHRSSHVGHVAHQHSTRAPVLSRSTSTGSAASSGSNSSASSEQGLLGRSPPSRPGSGHRSDRTIRAQPKQSSLIVDDLKGPLKEDLTQHKFICEQCGKCKCGECTAPRALPSCLACNRQCLCSAESMVEYGTCMCLVKGIFYHCSNDDEGDSYADNPCSCSQSHCCSRYLCMGAMSLFLPCLLCYPPAKGCLKLCRGCYDRVNRPVLRPENKHPPEHVVRRHKRLTEALPQGAEPHCVCARRSTMGHPA
ncbi:protein sprouty homolog 1 [Empidonax traillii]|uniref:protein sprouty homolog 1 n=1 Tax=Empidonax traillii TaxID=164674 RepID=UPI000FFD61D8|nr:protein sprouty homolog 1 [Empidonax traillii]